MKKIREAVLRNHPITIVEITVMPMAHESVKHESSQSQTKTVDLIIQLAINVSLF